MRSGKGRKSLSNPKIWAILAAAVLSADSKTASACWYHWALGLPEPKGVWPSAAPTAPQTASAAIAAVNQSDAIDDTAVAKTLSLSLAPATLSSAPAADSVPTDPYITGWLLDNNGATAHSINSTVAGHISGLPANIQEVAYSASNVYVRATGLPDYNIGPFGNDPNFPANDNATFEIPRSPAPASTPTATGLGAIGVLVNGVDVFNMSDANSYQNKGVWHNNAGVVEAQSFDAAKAHPQQQGVYHNHEYPISLEAEIGATSTNPMVIGYAIDGYPIFNNYASVTSGGPVLKMMSGYQLKTYSGNIRGNGGPNVNQTIVVNGISTTYVDGYFEEDYQYVSGESLLSNEYELDANNGAFVYTPQFPNGTYGYFATLDESGNAAYPYLLGPDYYGTPDANDLGSTLTVPNTATIYFNVPEPASLSFLTITAAPLLRRKRQSI